MKFISASLAIGLFSISMAANAALVFEDDFDADATANGTDLNFNGLANWTVDGGTIDLIESGGFGITCAGGSGGCIDLDGSTNNAGRMVTNSIFQFSMGTTYEITVAYSGNQRNNTNDSFEIQLLDPTTLNELSIFPVDGIPGSQTTFSLASWGFVAGSTFMAQLGIEGPGGDNIGVIIDNVQLCSESTCSNGGGGGPQPVPAPGALALLLLGLASLKVKRQIG